MCINALDMKYLRRHHLSYLQKLPRVVISMMCMCIDIDIQLLSDLLLSSNIIVRDIWISSCGDSNKLISYFKKRSLLNLDYISFKNARTKLVKYFLSNCPNLVGFGVEVDIEIPEEYLQMYEEKRRIVRGKIVLFRRVRYSNEEEKNFIRACKRLKYADIQKFSQLYY